MTSSELPRSLAFSQAGRDQVHKAARRRYEKTNFKTALANDASISRDTIHDALNLKNISFDSFEAICVTLELNWEDVSDPASYRRRIAEDKTTNVDELVTQFRAAVTRRICHDCSQMNPLRGRSLIDEQYVEPDLLRLRQLPSEQLVDDHLIGTQESIGGKDEGNYNRLRLYTSYETRLTAQQAVEDYKRLIVYSGPGYGKTSYLKWVAMQCIKGNILASYVPIFLHVRDFDEGGGYRSLHTIIEEYFRDFKIRDYINKARELLSAGHILLLLDGFDEIAEANRQQIIRYDVPEILSRYQGCRFIFSCRLPLALPFPNFERVLIAEFSVRKTRRYVTKWFETIEEDPRLIDIFFERLKHRPNLGELTRTPLLLELLCIFFRSNKNFPSTRADVYKYGIQELLKSRDNNVARNMFPREIIRDDIEKLLREIAASFFIHSRSKFFFYKRDLERKIEDYFAALFDINPSHVPAADILENLELHNGLLVGRSYSHCSFSHLTFQEYFTADYLVRNDDYETVYEHLIEQDWRFVIELVAQLLPEDKIDGFVEGFKQKLDNLVKSNDKIRNFLDWIDQIAASVSASIQTYQAHKQTLLRAWYFTFTFEDVGAVSSKGSISQKFDFPDYYEATSTITSELLDSHMLFYRAYHATKTDNYSAFLNMVHAICAKFQGGDPRLDTHFQSWNMVLKQQQYNSHNQLDWWKNYREYWGDRIGKFMARQHNLKCDWGFTSDEHIQLRQYYAATKLLSICMNRSKVSPEKHYSLASRMLSLDINPLEEHEFVGY